MGDKLVKTIEIKDDSNNDMNKSFKMKIYFVFLAVGATILSSQTIDALSGVGNEKLTQVLMKR